MVYVVCACLAFNKIMLHILDDTFIESNIWATLSLFCNSYLCLNDMTYIIKLGIWSACYYPFQFIENYPSFCNHFTACKHEQLLMYLILDEKKYSLNVIGKLYKAITCEYLYTHLKF